MDEADLDPSLHHAALASLARLNRWAQSDRILWPAIQALAETLPDRTCRVLDLATGAGDLPLALNARAIESGIRLKFTAVDISAQAITFAQRQADEAGMPIDFRRCDVLRDELPAGEYDVVISSLFLHHLDEEQALILLRKMLAATRRLALISDLRRSIGGLWLTRIAAGTLSRSPVVRADGPRSARAAFTIEEVGALARRAGWTDFDVQPAWPFRLLLTGRKEQA